MSCDSENISIQARGQGEQETCGCGWRINHSRYHVKSEAGGGEREQRLIPTKRPSRRLKPPPGGKCPKQLVLNILPGASLHCCWVTVAAPVADVSRKRRRTSSHPIGRSPLRTIIEQRRAWKEMEFAEQVEGTHCQCVRVMCQCCVSVVSRCCVSSVVCCCVLWLNWTTTVQLTQTEADDR